MTITIKQGNSQNFGETRVGVSLIMGEEARLVVAGARGKVQLTARKGDLLPLDGAWHRVVSVRDAGPAMLPGASGSEVQLETAEGPSFDASALFVPIGATANATGFDVRLTELAGDTAQLEVWPDTFARPQTKPELIKQFAVKRGERVSDTKFAVREVVTADASRGIRGWVELSV
jgi:hypothetical protein